MFPQSVRIHKRYLVVDPGQGAGERLAKGFESVPMLVRFFVRFDLDETRRELLLVLDVRVGLEVLLVVIGLF
jgi:hypothetical protein